MVLVRTSFCYASDAKVSDEELGKWLTYYYLAPEPIKALDYLEPLNDSYIRNKGISLADVAVQGGVRSFYAKILSSSPEAVRELERRRENLPIDVKAFVVEALNRCDSAACEKVRGSPFIKPPLEVTVAALDDYWAEFFATGERASVDRAIAALPLVETRGDVEKLLVGGAAEWSLSSNAYQHRRVLEFCKAALADAKEPLKHLLSKLVAEAEAERQKSPSSERR